jgi:hypothetical protein
MAHSWTLTVLTLREMCQSGVRAGKCPCMQPLVYTVYVYVCYCYMLYLYSYRGMVQYPNTLFCRAHFVRVGTAVHYSAHKH